MTADHLGAPRDVRRQVYAAERKERANGAWRAWEFIETPPELHQLWHKGWTRDIHTVARNGWCSVLIRDVPTPWGIVKHAAIRTALQAELGWAEMQRLKNEVFGADAVAIEVYPPKASTIDEADMYHLWVLPQGMTLPFGLHENDPGSAAHYRPEARRA